MPRVMHQISQNQPAQPNFCQAIVKRSYKQPLSLNLERQQVKSKIRLKIPRARCIGADDGRDISQNICFWSFLYLQKVPFRSVKIPTHCLLAEPIFPISSYSSFSSFKEISRFTPGNSTAIQTAPAQKLAT